MGRSLTSIPSVMNEIRDLTSDEERRFDTISSKLWDGDTVESFTDRAILIRIKSPGNNRDIWLPLSQMRKDDNGNVYLANWMQDEKGLT